LSHRTFLDHDLVGKGNLCYGCRRKKKAHSDDPWRGKLHSINQELERL
jgi:hypothetical protein